MDPQHHLHLSSNITSQPLTCPQNDSLNESLFPQNPLNLESSLENLPPSELKLLSHSNKLNSPILAHTATTNNETNQPANSALSRDPIHEQEIDIPALTTTFSQEIRDNEQVNSTIQTHVQLIDEGNSVQSFSEETKEPGPSIFPLSITNEISSEEQQEIGQLQQVAPITSPSLSVSLHNHHQDIDSSGPSILAQLMLSPPNTAIIKNTFTSESRIDSTEDLWPLSNPSIPSIPSITQSSRPPSTSSIPLPLPRLSLSSIPIFTSADEPPPYSPTHTILPHYFSLEPIPIRSYIIKESTTVPFIYDFWLCTSPQSTSPGLLFQERGIVQSPNELKYRITRPQHTDRTAFPSSGIAAQNAYFIPALALVSVNYPSRWIWWGTEALHMVVFGRELKNIIMEWKWRHGRLRIGGPIVHRLIGCSFSTTPERKYCWKQGSGRRRPAEAPRSAARAARQNQQGRGGSSNSNTNGRSGQNNLSPISEIDNRAIRGGWLGSFFGRPGANRDSSDPPNNAVNNIRLDDIRISIPPTSALESDNTASSPSLPAIQPAGDNPTLSEQEASADTLGNIEEDEESGCYHCCEECPSGITGRIVAVYKPGRPANRARDRPASSPKLEIFSELGERCETVLMLMCVRLDDLFMSIPDDKKHPFVPVSSGPNPGQGSSTGDSNGEEGGQDNENAEGERSGARTVNSGDTDISALKRLMRKRHIWKEWVKWLVAAILISVVVVLVLKSKLSKSTE